MEKTYYGLTYDEFFEIIDNLYDEIWVYNENNEVVYINQACRRHYGKGPDEYIGKNFSDLTKGYVWDYSVLPYVSKDKRLYAIKQKSHIGVELVNIATPILDENKEIKYIAMSVRDTLNEESMISERKNNEDFTISNEFIATSKEMKSLLKDASKIAKIDSTCLITGETGTGKTMMARYIHDESKRKNKPFITINCSSIPNELFESELFGYKKGAFTGAMNQGKKGLFEIANGGTIFLDEIGEMPHSMQAKLLHVIQNKEFISIGASESTKVDVKIITATNKNINKLIEDGKFRNDLYYRLNIFELYMLPLRDRKDDIEPLIYFYLNEFCKKYKLTHVLSKEVLDILKNYSWKGNVRELSHVIERMVVMSDKITIDIEDIPYNIVETVKSSKIVNNLNEYKGTKKLNYEEAIQELEKKIIVDSYNQYRSSRKVAESLGLSQTKASNLIRKYVKNR